MLEIKNLQKSFAETNILKSVNLSVNEGEFLVLVGPSGCGKSTLLRTIAGLEKPTSGEIHIAGKNVTHVEPQKRDVAMVFQNYALYPHMNVSENIGFGLHVRNFPKNEIESRVSKTASLLKIEHLLNRKPKELSGGQRQRVALGRALARRAPVLLFDEPLSNLDAHLRQEMRFEIKRLHSEMKNTVVYVTHDQSEALTLGDRIVVLNEGRVVQAAAPSTLYAKPDNLFVAGFIGSPEMNFISGNINNGQFTAGNIRLTLPTKTSGDVVLGVRPEDFYFSDSGLPFAIDLFENHGSYGLFYGHIGETKIVVQGPATESSQVLGTNKNEAIKAETSRSSNGLKNVSVQIKTEKIHLFDKKTGARIEQG